MTLLGPQYLKIIFLTSLKVTSTSLMTLFSTVNSQCHSSEDLDQALQAYQAFQIPCPQDSTMTPDRSINHHFTYHIAQASQAKHGSLVDRGANGGLAGSDVRNLSRSDTIPTKNGRELMEK